MVAVGVVAAVKAAGRAPLEIKIRSGSTLSHDCYNEITGTMY
jgi:hypothetical protein